MKFQLLENQDQLNNAIKLSFETPVLLIKHSERCSISRMAISRLERDWDSQSLISPYLIEVRGQRGISDAITQNFSIIHQSPQILLIEKGKCVYTESHNGINFQDIKCSSLAQYSQLHALKI